MALPFDGVLLIAFGGPRGPADIRPFLANVLRGRRVNPERVQEVAHHYDLFGGVSPITDLTFAQAAGLQARLAAQGPALPVYVGMRNWHPYLADTLRSMAADGITRAIGVIMAAHRSYSSCLQYKENVRDARAALRAEGIAPPEVVYAGGWHTHPDFIQTHVLHIEAARDRLPPPVRKDARVVFVAHSIPVAMANEYPYREQLRETATLVAARLETDNWALVYQSRSGRPEDQWLEPDVCEYLRAERSRGLAAGILAPIGFVCDHIEILYDLDREAADVCRAIGLPMARAKAPNAEPGFISVLADAVAHTWKRYERSRPLMLGGPC